MLKRFYSEKYRHYVEPGNKEYWKIVGEELKHRIAALEEARCTCMRCQERLKSYKDYQRKLDDGIINLNRS